MRRFQEYVQRHFQRLKKTENIWLRRTAGVFLVIGGVLGFLPVLGYWMLPLGLTLLAVESPLARRLYRQLVVGWGRNYQRFWPPARRLRKAQLAARTQRGSDNRGRRNGPSPR